MTPPSFLKITMMKLYSEDVVTAHGGGNSLTSFLVGFI